MRKESIGPLLSPKSNPLASDSICLTKPLVDVAMAVVVVVALIALQEQKEIVSKLNERADGLCNVCFTLQTKK